MAVQGAFDHKGTVIVCTSRPEIAYVLAWCDERGKLVANFMRSPRKYPYCLNVSGRIVGWTDQMDRNLHYMPFAEFAQAAGEAA